LVIPGVVRSLVLKNNMRIILHADDFGFDSDTVKATIDCFEKGALTSASIMPTMPAVKEAIAFAKCNPQFSFGVHLTYVDRLNPVSQSNKIKSLVDKDGLFLPSNNVRIKSLLHMLSKNEIVEETKRQIGLVIDHGIPISHVDSHGHLHKFPIFQDAIAEAIASFGIQKVRKGQDIFLNPINHAGIKRKMINALNSKMDNGLIKKFVSADHFYMPANSMDINWTLGILEIISTYDGDPTLEIGVHPGNNEKWRKHEYSDILEFASCLKETNNALINWNNI